MPPIVLIRRFLAFWCTTTADASEEFNSASRETHDAVLGVAVNHEDGFYQRVLKLNPGPPLRLLITRNDLSLDFFLLYTNASFVIEPRIWIKRHDQAFLSAQRGCEYVCICRKFGVSGSGRPEKAMLGIWNGKMEKAPSAGAPKRN